MSLNKQLSKFDLVCTHKALLVEEPGLQRPHDVVLRDHLGHGASGRRRLQVDQVLDVGQSSAPAPCQTASRRPVLRRRRQRPLVDGGGGVGVERAAAGAGVRRVRARRLRRREGGCDIVGSTEGRILQFMRR